MLMTKEQEAQATPEQIATFKRVVEFQEKEPISISFGFSSDPVLMLDFGYIVIGIETDGYAHS